MQFLYAIIFAVVPISLGLAILTNFRGLGASFSKEDNKVAPVIKLTGWLMIFFPVFPIGYEIISLLGSN